MSLGPYASEPSAAEALPEAHAPASTAAHRHWLSRRGELAVGITLLAAIVGLAIVVPAFSTSNEEIVGLPLAHPSLTHPFGLDELGRDVFVRTWAAARLDIAIAVLGTVVSLLFGTVAGVVAGYTRHRALDSLIMRIVDAMIAFPFIILALMLVVVLGPGLAVYPFPRGTFSVLIAVWIVNWTIFARLARAETLRLRSFDFVTASQLLGFSERRIVVRHICPHVFRVTAAYSINNLLVIILITAGLSFLGAGPQPPTPEWGQMMFEGRTVLATAWWTTMSPAAILAATGVAISLIADSVLRSTEKRVAV